MADATQPVQGLAFKLGSIPVLIRPAFFLIAVLGALGGTPQQGIAWVLVVLVSVLLHELGHAMTMMAFGYAPRIELYMMGGLTFWPTGARPGPGQRLLVSLSGPGIQLALGAAVLVGWKVLAVPQEWNWLLVDILWVNFGWALINLLPVLPWDGGQAVDSAITLKFGPQPKVVGVISMLFGAAIIGLAVWKQQIILGYLGFMGLRQGYERWSYKPPTAEDLLAAAQRNQLPLAFWGPLVQDLMTKGRPDMVRELFGKRIAAGKAITADDEKIAQVIVATLFANAFYGECADLCSRFFNETGQPVHAVNAASAFTKLGHLDDAMIWLERAIGAGFNDRASLATDEDLAPLRSRPDFQALLAIRTP